MNQSIATLHTSSDMGLQGFVSICADERFYFKLELLPYSQVAVYVCIFPDSYFVM